MAVLGEVKAGGLKVVDAAEALGLSYRQGRRIWKRYQKAGDAGLVHGLSGRLSGQAKPVALKTQVLARLKARYADFEPTLAAEHLECEGMRVVGPAQGQTGFQSFSSSWRRRRTCSGCRAARSACSKGSSMIRYSSGLTSVFA